MLILKKQTCMSDKMPPKKVEIKKTISKFAIFLFFNFNFLGGIFAF
jgi:hypothetical protein